MNGENEIALHGGGSVLHEEFQGKFVRLRSKWLRKGLRNITLKQWFSNIFKKCVCGPFEIADLAHRPLISYIDEIS